MEGGDLEGPYFPQTFWMDRGFKIPKGQKIVIRFENLESAIRSLPFVDNEKGKLLTIGRTAGDYRDCYTDRIQAKVAQLCDRDFFDLVYDPEIL